MDFELNINEIYECEDVIIINPSLKVECFCEDENDTHVLARYDFGMNVNIPVKQSHNFLLSDFNGIEESVMKTITFDLFHAFCHYDQDPNYSTYHWALYGNLKDRVEIKENIRE